MIGLFKQLNLDSIKPQVASLWTLARQFNLVQTNKLIAYMLIISRSQFTKLQGQLKRIET